MAVAGVQQTSPMCVFVRIVRQKIINYINKLVSILEGVSEAVVKCCISTSLGTSVAAIVPFFERDCAAQTPVANAGSCLDAHRTGNISGPKLGPASPAKRVKSGRRRRGCRP
jgi:hypothetical protein